MHVAAATPVTAQRENSRKKYRPSDHIDRLLRRVYVDRLANGRKSATTLEGLAKRVGWPKHALAQRARKLGLARVKEPPWSEAELTLLGKYGHLGDGAIQQKLKLAGFTRTKTAIHVKLARTHLRQGTDYLSATALAYLFGCDSHTVTRWIKLGYLKAQRKGTERTAQQGGNPYLIHEASVRAFVLAHPTEFDIRRVTDQLWFLDVVTNGKVGGGDALTG